MIWYSPTTSSRHSRSRRTICAVSSSLVQALLRLSRRKFGGELVASAAWSATRNVRVLAMRTCGKRACNVGTSHTNATCVRCPRPGSRNILNGCLVPLRYKHVALAAALEEANSSLVHVHAEQRFALGHLRGRVVVPLPAGARLRPTIGKAERERASFPKHVSSRNRNQNPTSLAALENGGNISAIFWQLSYMSCSRNKHKTNKTSKPGRAGKRRQDLRRFSAHLFRC